LRIEVLVSHRKERVKEGAPGFVGGEAAGKAAGFQNRLMAGFHGLAQQFPMAVSGLL
jgi:hypothetical protein